MNEKKTEGIQNEEKKRLSSFIKKSIGAGAGMISAALPYNMGASNWQPSLFDDLTPEHQIKLKKSDEVYIIDRQGRRVAVTPAEKRVIYALGIFISQNLSQEEIESIKDNEAKVELTKKEFSIDVKELADLIYHRSKKEQQEKVKDILKTLSGKRQVMEFISTEKKQRMVIEAPMIRYEESILIEDLEAKAEDSIKYNVVNLTFGRIFFWNLQKRYAYFPVKLFEIWHSKKSGTESKLFDVLLETLLYHRWHCITAYKSAKSSLDKELKEKGQNIPKEEYNAILYKRRQNALTYRESLSSILSRVETQYTKHRRSARLQQNINDAIEVLKGPYVEIIDEYRQEETDHETYLYFKYNPKYGHEPLLIEGSDKESDSCDKEENSDTEK